MRARGRGRGARGRGAAEVEAEAEALMTVRTCENMRTRGAGWGPLGTTDGWGRLDSTGGWHTQYSPDAADVAGGVGGVKVHGARLRAQCTHGPGPARSHPRCARLLGGEKGVGG